MATNYAVPKVLREAVLERDNYTCYMCGRYADTADHLVPRARGGTDDMSNLAAACRVCNGRKQDKVDNRNTWYDKVWLDHA